MEPTKNKQQVNKKSLEMCKYIAHVYRQRREELGLTKEEVAKRINKPVSIVTKSENSLCIDLPKFLISAERSMVWIFLHL